MTQEGLIVHRRKMEDTYYSRKHLFAKTKDSVESSRKHELRSYNAEKEVQEMEDLGKACRETCRKSMQGACDEGTPRQWALRWEYPSQTQQGTIRIGRTLTTKRMRTRGFASELRILVFVVLDPQGPVKMTQQIEQTQSQEEVSTTRTCL